MAAVERQSLNESMLVNALTDYLVKDPSKQDLRESAAFSEGRVRQVGEEMIIAKLNKIFDEVKQDN